MNSTDEMGVDGEAVCGSHRNDPLLPPLVSMELETVGINTHFLPDYRTRISFVLPYNFQLGSMILTAV